MTDDKKPDRFEERSIEAQLDGFLEAMKHWYDRYPTDIFPDYNLKDNPTPSIDMVSGKMARHILSILINEFAPIAEALREEAINATSQPIYVLNEPQLVSEEAYKILANECYANEKLNHKDEGDAFKNGFYLGFEKAQSMRATMEFVKHFPTAKEIRDMEPAEPGTEYSNGYSHGILVTLNWLKEKLSGVR